MPMHIHPVGLNAMWMPWKSTLSRVCQCPRIPTQSESVLGLVPGFANAHGNPQIFAVPWMPWKSTLSKSTLIEPGLANAHAYPPSLSPCHGCRLPWPSVLGLVPGFASAHGNPHIFAVPWMPWKPTLSQSTLIGPGFANAHGHPQIFAVPWMPWKSTLSKPTLIEPGFANAHAYPPSLCQCHGCRLPWSSVLGLVPGFANAHGNPQTFAVPWAPWKSTLSKSTRIEPGFANAHAYPPSLCQCHGCRLPWSSVLGLVPGFANAHGNPQIFAVPWMPWKSTLSQSTRIGPGFASAHAYPPSRIQCHVDAMEIHTIQGRVCQCPWTSTMDAMEIHTIQVYPYRARVCQCPCISTQSESKPWMQTTLVFCVRAGARLCQCPWKSTNLCSAMDAMEIHTIPVYPYRARVCQHAYPQIISAPLSQSTLIGPGFANAHAYPPSRTQCHVDAMEIHTIQGLPMPTHIHPV